MRVFILGAGRVGRGLAGALRASGVEVIGLHGRHPEPGITAGALPGTVDEADVVIVAVRDAQLEGALLEIAAPARASSTRGKASRPAVTGRASMRQPVVLHVSGSSTPRALSELRARGHTAGTFHPLVPIAEPAHAGDRLRGAWIGVDGDAAAIDAGRTLARHIGASTLVIPAGEKARYHAAAVFASNFPAVLAAMAGELMSATGVATSEARSAVVALLRASVANLHEGDPAHVLTGPIARGDAATVRAHLDALADDDLVVAVYRALSAAAVDLLDADPGADHSRLAEIAAVLDGERVPRSARETALGLPPPRIVRNPLARSELVAIASEQFGDMVKAVVDVRRGIMALGGELHSDEEALLLDDGSSQGDLWGINLYPGESDDDWIEYDSMINVRPSQGNRMRGVEDAGLRDTIQRIVNGLVN